MATNPNATLPPRSPAFHPRRALAAHGVAALAGAAFGCSSDPETSGSGTTTDTTTTGTSTSSSSSDTLSCSDDGDTSTATGDASADVLIGTFLVQLNEPRPASNGSPETPGNTAVLGKVYDGPYPAQLVWEVDSTEGDCRLVKPRVPFCSVPCGGSAVCVEDDTCQDYPKGHSAGAVSIEGLATTAGATGIGMCPVANNYQVPTGTTLNYPAFASGDDITLHADGDFYEAFDLSAKGIAQLVIASDTPELAADQPVSLMWTIPEVAAAAKIHVKLDISHHGGTKGMIECDTDDDGLLEIPAALVTKLLALGVAGFPSVFVTRKTVASTTIAPGRVDLVISSDVERTVTVAGLVSCTATTDCPDGQTCQDDLTCK